MRILHCVESYFPKPGGMQEVVRQLSERLAAMGHEVTIATRKDADRASALLNKVKIVDFEIAGNVVNGIEGDQRGYISFLLNSDFDVITFFAAQQWSTDLALPLLKQIRAKKVFVPTGFPGLLWPQYESYYSRMREWLHDFDQNVFLSYDYKDINFAKSCGITRWRVIANGADEREFREEMTVDVRTEAGRPADELIVLHVGSYTGFKGQLEAMDIFMRARIRNATLLLIGDRADEFRFPRRRPVLHLRMLMCRLFTSRKIIFRWYPRQFIVAAYRQADVFLFPSNIECSPIVLFECAAARLPFLSTSVGNAAEIAEWTGGGMILPTTIDDKGFSHANITASAKMLEEICSDPRKRKEMGENAYRTWQKKFTWAAIASEYEKLYLELTQ